MLDVGAVRDPGQLYPPGKDSVPAVIEIVLVDTVLTDTVSLVTTEKDPEGVGLDGSALPGSDVVWVDKPLELAEGDGTPDDPEPVAAQESRVLPDGPVESGGKGLLGGGAPYVGNTTEEGPAGVDADELLSPVAEDAPELSVAGSDGVPVEPLETAPEGEVVLEPVAPLGAGLDASTELLGPSPLDVTELEAGGTVALLLCGSELTPCDEVSGTELGIVVPGDRGFVVVGCAFGQS